MQKKQIRIGILTYHRSYNYGAFMQAYSLSQKLIQEYPDCNISVIDYISKEVYCGYHDSFLNSLYLLFRPKPFRRRLTYLKGILRKLQQRINNKSHIKHELFDSSINLLPISSQLFVTDNYGTISIYINANYDIVIVGSDAVWNWQGRPFPNIYFLGPEVNVAKFSYAASSYGQEFLDLKPKFKQIICDSWSRFNYVGVRDNPTEELVKFINANIEPKHNCDPTVFLDLDKLPVNRDLVYNKLLNAGFNPEKKSICIMATPWLAKYIKQELGDTYQIVSVFKSSEYADVNLLDINPLEWAICFSFFDLTITHYFHGNLLSLKNGTPTITIEQKSRYNQTHASKIIDFMTRVKLNDSCFYIDELVQEELKNKVKELIGNEEYINKIRMGLEDEAKYFDSFNESLNRYISQKH